MFPKIKLHSKPFFTEKDVYNAIANGLYGNHKRYDAIKGTDAKQLGFTTWQRSFKLIERVKRIVKYNYPRRRTQVKWSDYTSETQWKKTFRTQTRRRLRRQLFKKITKQKGK